MATSLSIFDVDLIVKSISAHLSVTDIGACRRVSFDWNAMFTPYFWSRITLGEETRIDHFQQKLIIKNVAWTRSLTIENTHKQLLLAAKFSQLVELKLYDGACSWYGHDYFGSGSILALLEQNRKLKVLSLDLDRSNFNSNTLAASILLAVSRHPSLTMLKWNVPSELFNEPFSQSLIYACQSLQAVDITAKIYDNGCNCGCQEYDYDDEHLFSFQDLPGTTDLGSEDSRVPLDQLEPFALRSLCLPVYIQFNAWSWGQILRRCPHLVDIRIPFPEEYHLEMLDILSGITELMFVDFSASYDVKDKLAAVRMLNPLKGLCLPFVESSEDMSKIISHISQPSWHRLEVLQLQLESTEQFLEAMTKLSHLKEIDVAVYGTGLTMQDVIESPIWACSHSLEVFKVKRIMDRNEPPMKPQNSGSGSRRHGRPAIKSDDPSMRQYAQEQLITLSRFYTRLRSMPRLVTVRVGPSFHFQQQFYSVSHMLMYANRFGSDAADRVPMTGRDLEALGMCYTERKCKEEETDSEWEEDATEQGDREYILAKSRNRYHSQKSKTRSLHNRRKK
ncbi:hypothetical protein BGZ94_000090 [Podila epigama]|nr:hypothetical protein BGZ94_000090 [Podila epigama]